MIRLALIGAIALLGLAAGTEVATAQSPEDAERMMRPLGTEDVAPEIPPELVVTRGWSNRNFGRIVFDWRTPVKFKAKVVGEHLKVTFDRPLKTKFDKASEKLSKFLSDLHVHGNKRSVSARLKGYYSLRSFSNENAVVIDLIPEDRPTGEADEDPDAWLARTPRIPVRAGKHPGFGRLVFDWTDEAGYEVERDGDVVRMRFDRPARIDVSRLSAALPGRISAATSETTKLATRVGFIIPGDAKIRHFRDGPKIALDIVAPEPPAKQKVQAAEAVESPEQINARSSKKLFGKDEEESKQSARQGDPVSLTKKARRLRRIAARKRKLNERKFKGAPLVTVGATRRGSALDIKFNWRKTVGAAVYRRKEFVWLVFDDRARLSLGSITVNGEGIVEDVEQTEASERSVVRLKVPEHLLTSVTKTGDAWNVRLAPARMTGPLSSPVQIKVDRDVENKPAILIGAKGINRPQLLVDNVVGDIVHVYPVIKPGLGNRVARNLVDFELPPSGAGLVLIPKRDDLVLIRNAEGVFVTTPDGLSVSRSVTATVKQNASESGHAFGPLSAWAGGKTEEYEKLKHLHLRRILVAPEKQRNDARLKLAQFYIAHGMAADAMGIIQVVLKQDPKLENDVRIRALRGAAHFLLGHYASAAREFEHEYLKNDPSVAPWRAAIAAAKGDWQKAHKLIRDSRGIVSSFPPWLKNRFHLIGGEAALAVNDIDAAKPWLDALRGTPLKPGDVGYLKYLEGHALRLAGKPSGAKGIWRGILNSPDRKVRAKAKFALINADLASRQISDKEAIQQLESLSFAWRGDSFEFDLKRRLGDIHANRGDYRASLLRLRQAASHFKDVEGAGAIAEDMRMRFKELFLGGGADKLEPVAALALYEEFRELTPAGTEGDEMIRKLADRLTKVDLLSEAGRLLEHQVRFRLTGPERSRIGARLAVIRMLDRQPAKAVEALKLSVGEELPEDLEIERRYMMVRALGEMGKPREALELLDGDVSHEAEILRLGLYWHGGNWPDVAKTVRRIIPQQSVESLSPKFADMVLRWAIALTMQNDMDGLLSLRDRFGPAMEKTKYHEAFKAVAGVEIGDVPDFKALVKRTGDLDDYRSFLASYRKKVQSKALSAIN